MVESWKMFRENIDDAMRLFGIIFPVHFNLDDDLFENNPNEKPSREKNW